MPTSMFEFSSPLLFSTVLSPAPRFENSRRRLEVEVDLRVPGQPEPGAVVDLVEQPEVDAPAPFIVIELEPAVAEGGSRRC